MYIVRRLKSGGGATLPDRQDKGFGGIRWKKILRYYGTKILRSNGQHYQADRKCTVGLVNPTYKKLPLSLKGRRDKSVSVAYRNHKSHFTHSTHFTHAKRAAFTLAEVLITLGIIGIVAAMTIPTLVQNYQKKLFETKVQYTYSLLSNVVQRSVAENGDINTWDYGTSYHSDDVEKFVKKYFEPYFYVVESGKSISYPTRYYYTKIKNGVTITWQFDGKFDVGDFPSAIYAIGSFNGNTSSFYDESRDYSHKDFMMTIMPYNNKLDFFSWSGNSRELVINHDTYGCNKNIVPYKRLQCGKLLQIDNFKIKDDYPW